MGTMMTLTSELVASTFKWAAAETERGGFNNRYSTRGAEWDPVLQALSKLCEYAFAQYAGVGVDAVRLAPDDGADVVVGDRRFDVKGCEDWKRLLVWPVAKNADYDKKNFTHLVLVKYQKMPKLVFEIKGCVTKRRFRDEHLTATATSKPPLDVGTWYMDETRLDELVPA